MKKHVMAAAVASALCLPGLALSAPLTVCPTGGATCYSGLTGLDWSQSNVIADQGNQAVANFQSGQGPIGFTVYAQGTLASFDGILGGPPPTLNAAGGFTWTYVLGFGEIVNGITTVGNKTTASFIYDPTNTVNFFEVYYTPVGAVNVSAGTGFNSGTKVFGGAFTGFTDANSGIQAGGSFGIQLQPPFLADGITPNPLAGQPFTQNLDQTPNNETGWASGIDTVVGSGTNDDLFINTVTATLSYVNTDFIKGSIDSYTLQNVSQTLPFKASLPAALGGNLDPSEKFATAAGGGAPTTFGAASIGDINGFPVIVARLGGQDIMFQSDFNSVISGTPIPEPGSLALLGLALAALGGSVKRRKS